MVLYNIILCYIISASPPCGGDQAVKLRPRYPVNAIWDPPSSWVSFSNQSIPGARNAPDRVKERDVDLVHLLLDLDFFSL